MIVARSPLAAAVLALALAAPGPRLPACTPAQREAWPVVRTVPQVEGRTILVHRSPRTGTECGEVQVSRQRPAPPQKQRGKR